MNRQSEPLALGPLMVDVNGLCLDATDKEVLCHPLVGGVILFARNFESVSQVSELVTQIKSLRAPELLVCVDQEGGRVQRFKDGFTILPPLHCLGRLYDNDSKQALVDSRSLARLMAYELKPTGIDFSFAPVVDLFDSSSEIIANRSFHHNPSIITELAKAYIHGLHDIGMIAVAKHFPGHGGVLEDSHLCLPADPRCFKDVEKSDIVPYQQLIDHGLDALMSAHVLFNHIDRLPSGFSKFWIQDIVRKKLGFNGIVFTDDLSMQGAKDFGGIIERTYMALNAGCDMALICNDRAAVEKVLDENQLFTFVNHDRDLSMSCRRTPQLNQWTPQSDETDQLLERLGLV